MQINSSENLTRFQTLLNDITGASFEIRGNQLFLPRTYSDNPVTNRLVEEIAYPQILIDAKGWVKNESLTDENYNFLQTLQTGLPDRQARIHEAVPLINTLIPDLGLEARGVFAICTDPKARKGATIAGENQQTLSDWVDQLTQGRDPGDAAKDLKAWDQAATEVTGRQIKVSIGRTNPVAELMIKKFVHLSNCGAIDYKFATEEREGVPRSVLIITDAHPEILRSPKMSEELGSISVHKGVPPIPLGK